MREFIDIVEGKTINEAGGLIDKFLSKIPGAIGASAGGRVDAKKVANIIKNDWVRTASASGINANDTASFKKYLSNGGIDQKLIDGLNLNLPAFDINKTTEQLAQNINKASLDGKTQQINQPNTQQPQQSQQNANPDQQSGQKSPFYKTMMKTYFNELGGDPEKAVVAASNVNPSTLEYDLLSLIGYAFLKSNGYVKNSLKAKK